MCWRVVLASLLAEGTQAFAPAPIRWGAGGFVLMPAPGAVGTPKNLIAMDPLGKIPSNELPYFSPRHDNTIAWNGMCLEASGHTVRINHCSGGSAQRWTWLPKDGVRNTQAWNWLQLDGGRKNQIQLKDTSQCLEVLDVSDKERLLNGAPVELRECENIASGSWQAEEQIRLPFLGSTQRPSSSALLRHVVSSGSVALLVAVSISAWLWRRGRPQVVVCQDDTPASGDRAGVRLTAPWPAQQTNRTSIAKSNVNAQRIIPAVMTVAAVHTETDDAAVSDPLASIRESLQNTWVRQLRPETEENLQKSRSREGLLPTDENRRKRPVFNGHYVLVKPTGLTEPRLVLWSKSVAEDLQLPEEICKSEAFIDIVSGNDVLSETWATPYALAIMGNKMTNQCPYKTGDGYGDGRAISIAELHDYELQLKGGGTTPFCRGGDGRAVLRSSIREFIASEAMHYLGVPTTRGLSLVVSEKDTAVRPWYTEGAKLQLPSADDPRFENMPEAVRSQALAQLRNQKADPNVLIQEKCAITCRVASSFTRVGHLDLFARRALKNAKFQLFGPNKLDTNAPEWKELEDLVWHACYREYREDAYTPFYNEMDQKKEDIGFAAQVLLEKSADRIAAMVANWIRVGFVQGNFNADNCLVGGKTMDYGPFGFVEEYYPLAAKWTGSAEHYGFLNQPGAGFANYKVLVESVAPVISASRGLEEVDDIVEKFVEKGKEVFQGKFDEAMRAKLGLPEDAIADDNLWQTLLEMMRQSRVDWTLFFRQLTYVMRDFPDLSSTDFDGMMSLLEGDEADRSGSSPFYEPLSDENRKQYLSWIEQWRAALQRSGADATETYGKMRLMNPKFVPREWMLVDAYTAADRGDETKLHELYELIQHPYGEGTPQQIEAFYRRAPEDALTTAGTAFMS